MTIANLPNEVNDELANAEAIYDARRCNEPTFEEMDAMLQILSFGAFLEQHGTRAGRALLDNFTRQLHEAEMRELRHSGEQLINGLAVLLLGDAEVEARRELAGEGMVVDAAH